MKTRVTVNTPLIKKAVAKYTKASKSVVFQASNYLRNEVVTSMYNSPPTGAVYRRRGITHTASSAGNPPRVDTGALVASVSVKTDADGLGSAVGSNIEYAASLEFGTSRMAARPFLHPAALATKQKIQAFIKKALT